jgi:hypothetical protein
MQIRGGARLRRKQADGASTPRLAKGLGVEGEEKGALPRGQPSGPARPKCRPPIRGGQIHLFSSNANACPRCARPTLRPLGVGARPHRPPRSLAGRHSARAIGPTGILPRGRAGIVPARRSRGRGTARQSPGCRAGAVRFKYIYSLIIAYHDSAIRNSGFLGVFRGFCETRPVFPLVPPWCILVQWRSVRPGRPAGNAMAPRVLVTPTGPDPQA